MTKYGREEAAHDRQDHTELHRPSPPVPEGRVGEGVFASTSAAVAAAVERMMEDESAREVALDAMAEEIRRRAAAPREDFVGHGETFGAVRGRLARG